MFYISSMTTRDYSMATYRCVLEPDNCILTGVV